MLLPKLVVFDLLGTLIYDDGIVRRCFIETLRRERLLFSTLELDAASVLPLREAFSALLEARDGTPASPELVDRLLSSYVAALQVAFARRGAAADVEGMWRTLVELDAAGIAVAVDTTLPRGVVDALVARSALFSKNLVSAIVTSDDIDGVEPRPDSMALAMTLAGVSDPKHVAIMGTKHADLERGMRAGCTWVVGAAYGRVTRADLIRRPHTHLVSRPSELLDVLGIEQTVPPALRRVRLRPIEQA
jgi:phosphoglycolate phosphatase-like HAD superfamily hydrolase